MKNKIIALLIANVMVMVGTTARAELLMPGCRTLKANSKTATYIVKVTESSIEYEANWYNPENDHLFHPQLTTHLQQKMNDGKWKTIYTLNGLQSIPSFPVLITKDGRGNKIKPTKNYRFLLENKNNRDIKVKLQYTPKYR